MNFQFLLSVAATFSLPVCDSNYHNVTQLLHWMLTIVHIPAVYISSCMYSNYVPELMTACIVVFVGLLLCLSVSCPLSHLPTLFPVSLPPSLSPLPLSSFLSLPSTPLLLPLSPLYPSPPLSSLPSTPCLFSSLYHTPLSHSHSLTHFLLQAPAL